ncbi:MAG: HU family DNA-binding protein [Akkermansia sp.]|nr:HU family DNA-binding protein [Akkermansia sp.]
MTTNRQALQELVRQHLGGTATPMAAQLALDAVLRSISDGLACDGEVKLAHFGTFKVKQRAARRLLLPGSKQEHILPSRQTVTFKGA